MKKLLTIAALVSATTFSFAQGTLNWANQTTTLISLSGGVMPARTTPETTFNFGLFIAPIGTQPPAMTGAGGIDGIADANWQLVAAYSQNSTSVAAGAGRLPAGTATIAGFNSGTSVNFIIRAWQSSTGGADWAAARPGLTFLGTSALGTAILGGGAFPLPVAFGTGAGQIGGFNVVPIPEPSSMALAGLGAASLLLFRRRK